MNVIKLYFVMFQFPLCPGAVPETYRVIIHNTNNSTRPPLVYGPSEVLLVSQGIQGDVYASNLHFTATLLLITHKLFSGEKYSLQIEAQNTLGRRNTTKTITIGWPFDNIISNVYMHDYLWKDPSPPSPPSRNSQ